MHAEVQRYYGEILQSSADLKTSACCTTDEPPTHIKTALAKIHDEVVTRYYGCGLVLPEQLDGASILDLGCGAGRDCYVLSNLVGADGHVIGVDMTPEQLDVARRYREYHAEQFGHPSPNVDFIEADIEKLHDAGLGDEKFDIIVSNCVINLATDKRAVLDAAFDLLKPGGEVYFADIYTDRRVPDALKTDPVLYGECLSGALYWNDFLTLAKQAGFADPRLVTDRPISVDDPKLAERVEGIQFFSATYRLFKLPALELACEDYGQTVCYRGTIPYHAEQIEFDKHHVFVTGETTSVCGNTFRMLAESRLAPAFDFAGDMSTHQGLFEGCGTPIPFTPGAPAASAGCC